MDPEEITWLAKVFRKTDMFASLTMAEMDDLIEFMSKYKYPKGEKIIKQGELGDSFFMIYKGKVKAVIKKGFFKTVELNELGPEQFFGEMSLLTDEPRSATITAVEDTECFVLFKGQFQLLRDKNPKFEKVVQMEREKRNFEIRRKQT